MSTVESYSGLRHGQSSEILVSLKKQSSIEAVYFLTSWDTLGM